MAHRMSKPPAEILADTAAAGSVATFLGIALSSWEAWINILAGLVAIIAGLSAAAYHIAKLRKLNKKDQDKK